MALWDKLSSRGRVEDRRNMVPAAIGGIGIGSVALYLVANILLGGDIDILQIIGLIEQTQVTQQQNLNAEVFQGEDSYEVFAATVLGSNNELWEQIFAARNQNYLEPTLVLFRTATQSSCGTATSQVGPHYCSRDQTIYLDETFFEELQQRFGAQGGDVAEAYVIAHEVGHHVQNLLGTLETVYSQGTAGSAESNELFIRLELQADCYAGLWANSIKDAGVLLPGEIAEAMDAAAAVGDDRIQEKVTGYVNPESWTHGSSEQRVAWFTRGYDSGDVGQCDTFE